MDKLMKNGLAPKDILSALRAARARRGESGPSKTAVYNFLRGKTYERDGQETRGRRAKLPPGLLATANRERLRLIKAAGNEHLVTWEDIAAATKQSLRARGALTRRVRMPSADWLARLVRAATPVRARPGKRRISRFPQHVKAWGLGCAAGAQARLRRSRACVCFFPRATAQRLAGGSGLSAGLQLRCPSRLSFVDSWLTHAVCQGEVRAGLGLGEEAPGLLADWGARLH